MPRKTTRRDERTTLLKGWKAIGGYLGIGAAAAQRWAKSGMPVRREERFTVADVDEIRKWLGRESHMAAPAHISTPDTDVAAALKESIAAVKRKKQR